MLALKKADSMYWQDKYLSQLYLRMAITLTPPYVWVP